MPLRRASGRSVSTTRSRNMVEKCRLGLSSQQPLACSHSPLHTEAGPFAQGCPVTQKEKRLPGSTCPKSPIPSGANLRSQGALRCAEGATASPSRSQPPLPHRPRCRATPHRALSAQPQPDRVVRPLCGRLALGAAYMLILWIMPSLALACRSSSPQTSTQGVHREARGPEAPHTLTRGELSGIGMLVRGWAVVH